MLEKECYGWALVSRLALRGPSMTVLIGLMLFGYNFQHRPYLDSAGLFEIWAKEINPNSCLLSCSFSKFYGVLMRKNIIYTLPYNLVLPFSNYLLHMSSVLAIIFCL